MTLLNDIMPYFDEFIHVYGWNMSILWSPLKMWMPKNFTTANFRHPVSKSWLRHWLHSSSFQSFSTKTSVSASVSAVLGWKPLRCKFPSLGGAVDCIDGGDSGMGYLMGKGESAKGDMGSLTGVGGCCSLSSAVAYIGLLKFIGLSGSGRAKVSMAVWNTHKYRMQLGLKK